MTNLQPKLWTQFNKLKRSLTPTQTPNNPKKVKLIESEKTLISLLNTDQKTLNWSPKLNLILLGIIIQFTSNQSNSSEILDEELWECINQKFQSYWLLETYEGLSKEVNVKVIKINFQ
jgi:hypothetical protein